MISFCEYIGVETIPWGFWKKNNKLIKENILKWIKWFEITNNLENREDWYKISGEQINTSGARGFFTAKAENSVRESMYDLMKLVYPEYDWIPWNFIQAPQGYWKIKENRLLWCETFRKKHNIIKLEDFYNYQLSDYTEFGGRCVNYYGESFILMLKELYPEYEWLEWRFKGQVPKNFWTDKKGICIYENIKRWFDKEIIESVGFNTKEDMYKLTQPIISNNYGQGLLTHHLSGSPMKLLQFLYPDYDWLFWKFVSSPNNAWDSIKNQRKYLLWLINNEPIEILYKISSGSLPGGFSKKYKSYYELVKTCFPEKKWEKNLFNCHKTEAKILRELKNTYPKLHHQFRIEWCKNNNTKRLLPFDFCIEDYKLIIELDGIQHFKQVMNWKSPEDQHKRDIYKMKCANQNGYSIIRILQEDVIDDKYEWLLELKSNIEKIVTEKKTQNIFMCKKDEYKIFYNIDYNIVDELDLSEEIQED